MLASQLAAGHVQAVAASIVAAGVVFLLARIDFAWGLAATLLALIASNSSISGLKEPFLTARWAALGALAVALVPDALRARRHLVVPALYLAPLVLYAFVSIAWSVEPRLTAERAVSFAVLLWVVGVAAVTPRVAGAQSTRVVDVLAATTIAVLAGSILLRLVSSRATQAGVFRGVFENENGLGLFLGLTFPFVADALARRGRTVVPFAVLGVFVAVVYTAHARGGLLALALTALAYVWTRDWARRLRVLLTVALVAAAAAAAIAVTSTKSGSSTIVSNQGVFSTAAASLAGQAHGPQSEISRLTGARSEAWQAAAGLIASRPVLGYGFGTGDRIFSLYPNRAHFQYFEGANPNNAYLQLVLEVGAVGAAVFLVPLLAAGGFALSAIGRRRRSAAIVPFAAVVIGGLAVGIVESVFTSAGAPWELLIWLSALLVVADRAWVVMPWENEAGRPGAVERKWRLSRRTGSVVALATLVLAGALVGVAELTKRAPLPPIQRAARTFADHRCGGCRVAALTEVQPGFWWLRLAGATPTCYVIDRARFGSGGGASGVLPTRCEHLPLREAHVLTVSVLQVSPPYLVPPLTSPTGFEATLVRRVARSLGIGLVHWTGGTARQRARADVIVHAFAATPLPPDFIPYRIFNEELLALRGSRASRVQAVQALDGFRLGVVAGPALHFVHQLLGERNTLSTFPTREAGAAALARGRIDALLDDEASASAVVQRNRRIVAVGLLPADHAYGIAFGPNSKIAPEVTAEMSRLRASGALAALSDQELGRLSPLKIFPATGRR